MTAVRTPFTTPGSTELAMDVLTAGQYLGLLVFAGLVFFQVAVLREPRLPRRLQGLLRGAALVAVLSSILLVPASALRVVGAEAWSVVSPRSWLPAVLPAPGAAAILVTAAVSVVCLVLTRRVGHVGQGISLLCATLAVTAPVLVGHTQSVEPQWAMVLADVGHLLAAAFWAGGLAGLALYLPAIGPRPGHDTDPLHAVGVTVRFSTFALVSTLLLAVSGTVMAVLIVETPQNLVGTGYGRALLVKLGVIAVVIALAAWNRHNLLRRIVPRPTVSMRWRALHRVLVVEASLLVAAVVITGILTNSSPGHSH